MKAAPRIIVLMYHRIDKRDTDPWGICVSPEHFDEQIQLVKNRFPVITVGEAIQQVTAGVIPETSVCITFDDGYADNFIRALPVLKRYDCPAAIFIPTAFTGSAIPFWWDELEMICLHSKQLPPGLQLSINNTSYRFYFETSLSEQDWQQHLAWMWYEKPLTLRCDSFLKIWSLLRPLPYSEIETQMNNIRSWANADYHLPLPMNENQLKQVCNDELITVGLHTHTHADLANQDKEQQASEITKCSEVLSHQYKIHSSVLAYPFGSFADTTLSVAKQLYLAGCFTTEPVSVTADSDIAKLGRYQVFDWNAHQFAEQLSKWTSG